MKLSRNPALFFAGMALICTSLACGALQEATPAPEPGGATVPPSILPTQMISPPTSQTPTTDTKPVPAIPERRRSTLEFPPQIREGDSDIVRLTLEVDKLGNMTPTAEISGNTVTGGTVEIPNLYETHNIIAEARLDMAGVEVRPPEQISAPLAPGQRVTFYWSVKPQGKGSFRGTAWLFLRFVDKSTGQESRRPLSAQVIEIQSTDLFGFSAKVARTTGAVGSLVGGIIGFPFFEDIVKYLFRRRRRQ